MIAPARARLEFPGMKLAPMPPLAGLAVAAANPATVLAQQRDRHVARVRKANRTMLMPDRQPKGSK